jgi:hypothetical protein
LAAISAGECFVPVIPVALIAVLWVGVSLMNHHNHVYLPIP